MKKAISLILALVMLFCANSATVSYAASKVNAEDSLVKIQKQTGYIPGKQSVVTGNCFAFVSAVCEKLYGVTYWYEQMNSNYSVNHTGNFYTVKSYRTSHTTPTTTDAKNIRDYFINYAQPGDIVHYGGLNGGSTHTFMIQHIDSKKMQIYHSNYGIYPYSSADCHIDDLVWSSFVDNPTSSQYNADGSCYSMNSMFYNKMKSSGLGITINRYSKYTSKFNTIDTSAPVANVTPAKITGIELTGLDRESISLKWNEEKNSSRYYIYIKNLTKGTTFDKTVTTNSTTLAGLTDKNKYEIKIKGYNAYNKAGSYSDPVTITTKYVSKPSKITGLAKTDVDENSISIKWNADKNASSYNVNIKNNTKGTTFNRTSTTNSIKITGLTKKNKYTIRVKGININNASGSYSDEINVTTKTPSTTVKGITITAKTTSSLSLEWDKVTNASSYYIFVKNETMGNTFDKSVTTTSTSLNGLNSGNVYSIKIRAYIKDVGYKDYSNTVRVCSKPNKVTLESVTSPAKNQIKPSWYRVYGSCTGYHVRIATDKDFKNNVKNVYVDGKSTLNTTIKTLTSGKTYYVKVRAYKTVYGKKTYGAYSAISTVKCK